ncbi:hypothetical protein [Aliiglaciecola sp. LCG003]|uniref:DUF6942 family protein n=1 Tax=Aliiglaciecola sp. LCG003 TaxID=3053655 RepID=UPI00257284B5|nr:hypothetical protein [Aliiglaciecola sp. LCG003]WJG11211.1 hypothetical protein QR722_09340 [Aliiglaciecola sp. LCG003]
MSKTSLSACIGLGDPNAKLNLYLSNRPDFDFAASHSSIAPLEQGEIFAVGQSCGNGWRKVFNVYAKLIYALPREFFPISPSATSWQHYRDMDLLQSSSNTALIFNSEVFNQQYHLPDNGMHIVMGRTFAATLEMPMTLRWLSHEFAIDTTHKIIVCPYFDYRQLSNAKIIYLVDLISTQMGLTNINTSY